MATATRNVGNGLVAMKRNMPLRKHAAPILAAALLGAASIIIPALAYAPQVHEDSAFAPLILRSVEGLQPAIVWPLLLFAGYVAATLGCSHSVVIGISTIVILPIWSVLDMILGNPVPERHNLLPIEWLFYFTYSAFGMLGASLAKKRRTQRQRSIDP